MFCAGLPSPQLNRGPAGWGVDRGLQGTKKTPVLQAVLRPLEMMQTILRCNQGKITSIRDLVQFISGTKTQDSQLEELGTVPNWSLIFPYDELISWWKGLARYQGGEAGAAAEIANWLSMVSGAAVVMGTKGQGSKGLDVFSYAANLVGNFQPGVAESLLFNTGTVSNGLVMRWLMVSCYHTPSGEDEVLDVEAEDAALGVSAEKRAVFQALADEQRAAALRPFAAPPVFKGKGDTRRSGRLPNEFTARWAKTTPTPSP
uniref:Uncharacterized protein n=1 Tax=Dunaliella tertiolecta TaxID=3047 RepID=A0A7S3VJI8_DUNTE|mmetsp:Transcript_9702/g.26296  ORF Transcript_9702/g.26296 Transcript_9702/m.26296 type:complete len:259 (+) Transcript_9702:529-1305(+)